MQTFRAYIQNASGAITWAAWIEAAHLDDARGMADAMRQDPAPTLELWSASERRLVGARLDPV